MSNTLVLTPVAPGNSRLVITRRHGQAVRIGDALVTVRIVRGEARLSIEAPRDTKILRTELESRDSTELEPRG